MLDSLLERARTQLEGLHTAEAVTALEEALALAPGHAEVLHLQGLAEMQRGRDAEAVRLIEQAIAVRPGIAAYHHNAAGIHRRLGRMTEARARYRRAIELRPGYAEAYQGLAEIVRAEPGDPLLGQIERQLDQAGLPPQARSYLHFAAGKLLDDLGRHDEAFAHVEQGNRLAGRRFDLAGHRRWCSEVLYTYGPEYLAVRQGQGLMDPTPVFIIGMPRSGTSLLEQALSSHPRVFGAGERADIPAIARAIAGHSRIAEEYPACMPGVPGPVLRGFGQSYVNALRALPGAGGALRIVDKNPLNFLQLGLIREMLPAARIIHIRRDPRDTALSCYFQNFSFGQDYSFDLATLGAYYADYRRLMAHWRSVFGDWMLELDYEALVADLEGEMRRVLGFCGLDWDPAVVEFHRNPRGVATASVWQVRQPVYTRSVARWRRYESHLGPFLRALADRLPPAEAPTPSIKGEQP